VDLSIVTAIRCVTGLTSQHLNNVVRARVHSFREHRGDEMMRIRALGSWLLTGVLSLATVAGISVLYQTPGSVPSETSSSRPPALSATGTVRAPAVHTRPSVPRNYVREASLAVAPQSTTTTSTTTSIVTTTTSTTSSVPSTTTTAPHHHDGGDDDGGSGDGPGSDDGPGYDDGH
jgi:hypothetical protein